MLRPKYLEQLPSSMVELYSQVEQDILANMAARIAAFDLYGPPHSGNTRGSLKWAITAATS